MTSRASTTPPSQSTSLFFVCDPGEPRGGGEHLIGSGFTKVRDDEWSAALVLACLRWLSARYAGLTVCVSGERDLIRAPDLLIQAGRFSLDTAELAERVDGMRRAGDVVQALAGHPHLVTTQRYPRVVASDLQKAAARFGGSEQGSGFPR